MLSESAYDDMADVYYTTNGTAIHMIYSSQNTGRDQKTEQFIYSGPCILRPPIQPEKYGLKLKMVLKWIEGLLC